MTIHILYISITLHFPRRKWMLMHLATIGPPWICAPCTQYDCGPRWCTMQSLSDTSAHNQWQELNPQTLDLESDGLSIQPPYMYVFVSVCNVQVFGMWGEKADPKIQTLHLSWSAGSIIVPFMVRPFLVDRPDDIIANTTTTEAMMTTSNMEQTNAFEIPYLIIGSVLLLTGVVALCIYICTLTNRVVASDNPVEKVNDASTETTDTDHCFFIQMLVLVCLLVFAFGGREYTVSTWMFTYAIESDLGFTKSEAALLTSANRASYTAGHILSTVASKCIGPPPIIFTAAGIGMIFTLALAVWGTQYKAALWVFSCLLELA